MSEQIYGGDLGDTEEVREEKQHLIGQILDLQNTLDALACKVDKVNEENHRLKAENQVLGQYIESLMAASNMFQTADSSSKTK